MARVRSTDRVAREGEEAGPSETAPISEMMNLSGLIVQEEKEPVSIQDVADAEAKQPLPNLVVKTKMMMAF